MEIHPILTHPHPHTLPAAVYNTDITVRNSIVFAILACWRIRWYCTVMALNEQVCRFLEPITSLTKATDSRKLSAFITCEKFTARGWKVTATHDGLFLTTNNNDNRLLNHSLMKPVSFRHNLPHYRYQIYLFYFLFYLVLFCLIFYSIVFILFLIYLILWAIGLWKKKNKLN